MYPVAYDPGFGRDERQSWQALTSLPGADQLDAVEHSRVILIDDF